MVLGEHGPDQADDGPVIGEDAHDVGAAVGRQNLGRLLIGDAEGVLELLWLLVMTVLAWARPRHDLNPGTFVQDWLGAPTD